MQIVSELPFLTSLAFIGHMLVYENDSLGWRTGCLPMTPAPLTSVSSPATVRIFQCRRINCTVFGDSFVILTCESQPSGKKKKKVSRVKLGKRPTEKIEKVGNGQKPRSPVPSSLCCALSVCGRRKLFLRGIAVGIGHGMQSVKAVFVTNGGKTKKAEQSKETNLLLQPAVRWFPPRAIGLWFLNVRMW